MRARDHHGIAGRGSKWFYLDGRGHTHGHDHGDDGHHHHHAPAVEPTRLGVMTDRRTLSRSAVLVGAGGGRSPEARPGLIDASTPSATAVTTPWPGTVGAHAAEGRTAQRAVSRRGLIGMGVAGGLVPSPSALIILLSAIALGRTWFGIVLVLSYGLGMAATLTAAGLVLVTVRDRYRRRTRRLAAAGRRWGRIAPYATAALVVVGLGLVVRSFRQV